MGTNFYFIGHRGSWNPEYHIGKRSASGDYCWDCGVTLCKSGESNVHKVKSVWYEQCPKCGKKPKGSGWDGAVGVELGFAEPYKLEERVGVRGVSSFTWAMNSKNLKGRRKVIDEYGRKYSMKDFVELVLGNCPIQFFHMIGRSFS